MRSADCLVSAQLLSLVALLPLVQTTQCACNFDSTKICCGQHMDQGRDHCVDGGGRQCPADAPTCTSYVQDSHMGTCKGSKGDVCEAGMIGVGIECPPRYTSLPGGCLVKKDQANEACRATAECEYIGVCSNKAWNERHPDSVQLYQGPLKPNDEWECCKKVPPSPPTAAGMAFVTVLGIIFTVYIAGGVALGRRSGGASWSLKIHPHHRRWLAVYGLVQDGCSFVRGRWRGGARDPAPLLRDKERSASKVQAHHATREGTGSALGRSAVKKGRKGKRKGNSDRDLEKRGAAAAAARPRSSTSTSSTSSASPGAAAKPASKVTAAGGAGRWVHVHN
jgi:hypothetical protein